MKTAVVLPLLMLIVLTSGCTIPGLGIELPFFGGPQVKEYEHDILIIKSLQAIPPTIAPGQQVRLITYVQNIGKEKIPQEDGKKVVIELYDYCDGLFTLKENAINCPGKEDINNDEHRAGCEIDKILPGQIVEVDWVLEANKDIKLETICPLDGMKIMVKYPYITTSLTTITLINADEMQRQIEEGSFQRKESYIVAGQGPIKPFLYVEDAQPISQESQTTVFSLQIENKGSGFLAKPDGSKDIVIPQEKVGIKMPDKFKETDAKECNFKQGSATIKGKNKIGNYIPADEEGIRLIFKKSPKLLCEFNIPQPGTLNIAKETTLHATVDIEYEYEFRASVKVVVSPKM